MSILSSVARENRRIPGPTGPTGIIANANNGLSLDTATGTIAQLGQDVGAVGDPAALLSNREIPMGGFSFLMGLGDIGLFIQEGTAQAVLGDTQFNSNGTMFIIDSLNQIVQITNLGSRYLLADVPNASYQFGDIANTAGGSWIDILDLNNAIRINLRNARALQFVQQIGNSRYDIGDLDSLDQAAVFTIVSDAGAEGFEMSCLGGRVALQLQPGATGFYSIGDVSGAGNGSRLSIDDTVGEITFRGDVNLHRSTTTLFNGAGALAGTLNNSPVAGDPTKWVRINDNGTVRFIPAW